MPCLSVCFFFHFNIIFDQSKVNNFRETKIVDWHRAVTMSHVGVMFFFVYVITYIVFSFCSLSNEKSLFSNVSAASFVSFLYVCILLFAFGKKRYHKKRFERGHKFTFLFFESDLPASKRRRLFFVFHFHQNS